MSFIKNNLSFTERLKRRKLHWNEERLWQRRLSNKLESKIFASQLGVPVPKLYWHGYKYNKLPSLELPDTFVMKPLFGHSAKNVVPVYRSINNRTGIAIDWKLIQRIYKSVKTGALIEEYIPTADGQYNLVECFKVFVFGDAMIIRFNRDKFDTNTGEITCICESYFTDDWQHINERISVYADCCSLMPAPPYLHELLQYARCLGDAYGTFVRIDFYLAPGGPRFGEFCAFPFDGKHFTDYGNRLFASLWETHLGDAE